MARSKTPLGAALGCGCALLAVVGVIVFVCCIVGFVFSMIKNSDPYNHALAQARNNPQVVTALGEPIEPGWFLMGNINLSGSSGNADISIPISGPNGNGQLNVVASKSGGVWTYSVLRFTSDQIEQPLNLLLSIPALEELEVESPRALELP
ncbi:MAG: hypothetical protein ACI9R3_002948 [Verrucomicrobiales bacterium]|jgi:hypothetical protein